MGEDKERLALVVIGHVDSGKSTTTGHLIFKCGGIDQRVIAKFEKEANEIGKGTFKYAWVLDKLKAERERGITIQASLNKFITDKFQVTIIDAPGHRDFIKNMITGTSQADVAILIVSAAQGEFEAGISPTGSTNEHTQLANTLGVENLIIAVNKMDNTGPTPYSEERFNEIKSNAIKIAKKFGYKDDRIIVIPISGWNGDNLKDKTDKMPWWKGSNWQKKPDNTIMTIVQAVDSIKAPERPSTKPLRMPLQDVYKIAGIGTVPVGRVECGVIKPGMKCMITPPNKEIEIKSVEMHHESVPQAIPGDNIGFNYKGNLTQKEIKRGCIVSDAKNDPAKYVEEFTAKVIITNHPGTITAGYAPVVDCHTDHVSCKFIGFTKKWDRKTGALIEELAVTVKKDEVVLATLQPTKPMVVESFEEYGPLGRFAIRDMNQTVGIGVIKTTKKSDVVPACTQPKVKGATAKAAAVPATGAKAAKVDRKKG